MKELITICLAATMILAMSGPSVMAANLLINPGFEANSISTSGLVLGNFQTGIWGVEAATITGVNGGITPFEGVKMLRMTDPGGNATQGFQVTNVSGFNQIIDSGNAIVNLSAMFNADVNAARCSVGVWFFTNPVWTGNDPHIYSNFMLDNIISTWQMVPLIATIPVGTRWLVTEVLYTNSSMGGHPGYVDAAELTITPEPATMVMLGFGALSLLRRKRGKA